MKSVRYSAWLCVAAGLILSPGEVKAEEAYGSTSVATASRPASTPDSPGERKNLWSEPKPLLPKGEWKPYVGRPSAFAPGDMPIGGDPARIPSLSGGKSTARAMVKNSSTSSRGGGGKSSSKTSGNATGSTAGKTAAKAPKPDPCEEKVRQALEEAAKSGKIPASAVPPAATPQSVAPQSSRTVSTGANPQSAAGQVVGQMAGRVPSQSSGQLSSQSSNQIAQAPPTSGASPLAAGNVYTGQAPSVAPSDGSSGGGSISGTGALPRTAPFTVD